MVVPFRLLRFATGTNELSAKFSKSTGWIIERRWLAAIIILIISVIATGGYYAPVSVVEFFKSLVEEEKNEEDKANKVNLNDHINEISEEDDFEDPPIVQSIQLSGYDVMMVVESDSFFSPNGAAAIRGVVDRLESLDYVSSILWMDKIPTLNLFGLNEPLLPKSHAAQVRFEHARDKAKNHPLVNGQLLSADGKTLILMISIDYLFIEDDHPFLTGMRAVAEEEAAKHPDVEMNFLVTGSVPVHLTVIKSHEENQLKYQMIAYGMILILSMILFRGITAVIVVALAPVFGVFWTLGFIRYFEFQLNPFNDVVLPVLIALVAFTDGVHLMVQIRRERAKGLGPFAAAKEGVRVVGLACFLTSLTTAVGFGSLALAHNELVREFGYCCVIGVMLSFISVVLTIPLACSTWLGRRIHIGHGKGFIDQNIGRISVIINFVLKHKKWVSITGIVVSITCFLISLTLGPDEKYADILPPSSEPAVALRKLDAAMGGLSPVHIQIFWEREGQPELLQVLGEIDQLLAKEELIGHPISVYNLLDALPGDGKVEDRASMLDLFPPELKRSYYQPEFRKAQVDFRVRDLGIAKYGPVFQRVSDGMEEIIEHHPEFKFQMSGEPIWKWRNIYQIVIDLVTSLGTAAVVIFGILSIVYRSIRIGIISILPNLFPLCVAGTYLVLTGQMLEIVTVCAFTCCLGVAVDDTIHFLTRYVEEKRETKDEEVAIRKAFTAVGTALVVTTVVLVSGFLTVLMSETREHRIFASMGAITVAAALFGDLVFLPAILSRFSGNSKTPTDTDKD